MRVRHLLLTAGLLAASVGPAAAQEHDVARGSYPFFSRTLTISVNAEMDGELQIIRSRAARVDIAALASPGVASFGLGGFNNDELRLTAAGADRAAFIVTVPERVYVTVRAPGTTRAFGAFLPVETVRWQGARPREHEPAREPWRDARASREREDEPGLYPLYGRVDAPSAVAISDLAAVRSIEVRFEHGPFALHASRSLPVRDIRGRQLAIAVGEDPVDLLLVVPLSAPDFTLGAGSQALLTWTDGAVRGRCSPSIEQKLDGGRIRVLLTPHAGRLDCPVR